MAFKAEQKINFKRDEGGGLRPDGVYRLKVEDVEVKQASDPSKFPYLNVRFSVLYNGQPKGLSVWDILSYSPAARFKFDQILDAMNAPEDGEVSYRWLKGKQVFATLTTATHKGKVSNKVGQYLTAEAAAELQEANLGADSDDDFEDDDDLEDSDTDDDDEDEDEEEVVPVKAAVKAKAANAVERIIEKKTAAKATAKKKPVVDEDDDDEDIPF